MDKYGIAITALSSNDPGPEWFGEEGAEVATLINDFIAEVARAHSGRFYGLCLLPLQDPAAAEKELDRCFGRLGMRGILLYSNLKGAWPDEPQFRWLFAAAEQKNIPILLHPAMPMTTEAVKGYDLTSTMGNMFENTIALARIIASGLLDEHPGLKLLCPHVGGTLPYIAGRFDHQVTVLKRSNQKLQRTPTEYLRESVWYDIVTPQALSMKFALDFAGPDRLVFASDHPWVDPGLILSEFESLQLAPEVALRILSGNARRFFAMTGIGPKSPRGS